MIEINLIPDVKQELIRAQQVRASVVSVSIFVSLIALGILVTLCVYIFGVQTVRSNLLDGSIKSESEKLSKVEDLSKVITIQNQLTKLSTMHNDKLITSRLFDILATIDPPSPNNMTISNVQLATETDTVTIEGFASNGYSALEIFKKTIEATKMQYKPAGETEAQDVSLATGVNIVETSYGENSDGSRVLRFTISFEYPTEIFARGSTSALIIAPTRENATDSFRGLPTSLFGDQATDVTGGN